MDRKDGLLRSLLFVPGSDTRKLGKVARFGADAIVIDLEDAVADEEKVGARATTRAAIPIWRARPRWSSASTASRPGCSTTTSRRSPSRASTRIMVPKVESADTLAHLDDRIAAGRGGRRHRAGNDPRPRAHRDRARDRRLRGDPRGRARARAHRRLRRRRLLRAARHRPHARRHRDRLRALAPRRRRARRGPAPRRSTAPGCGSRTTRAWRPTAGARAGSASRAA